MKQHDNKRQKGRKEASKNSFGQTNSKDAMSIMRMTIETHCSSQAVDDAVVQSCKSRWCQDLPVLLKRQVQHFTPHRVTDFDSNLWCAKLE